MNCDEVRERIVAGETGMEAHLASCPECREFAAVQRDVDAELRAAFGTVTMPAQLRSRLRAAARGQERRARLASFGDWVPLAVGLMLTSVCMLLVPAEGAVVAVVGVAVVAMAYLWEAAWDR